jgi:3-phosphoshikimate 1-carboxyvinyltransferase
MASIASATVKPARCVRGRLHLPGDKSISHRYALLAALADGRSVIRQFSSGADCAATLDCLRRLGAAVEQRTTNLASALSAPALEIQITGRGLRGLIAPEDPLNAQNSGTTMRMLSGIVAAHPFTTILKGDASLTRRPMRRVIDPLERMGARILSDNHRPPLTIIGGDLHGTDYALDVPSAQVKSAILLAGLQAAGITRVVEPVPTRNHTELALRAFGVAVSHTDSAIEIQGGQRLAARNLVVPGDISAAAFWAAAAAAMPDSELELENVGLNPTRTALLDVLERAGAKVEREIQAEEGGEPRGLVRIRHVEMKPLVLGPRDVPALIDELPVLAAHATFGGELVVTGAAELRVKESDRISALVHGLRALGADIDEMPDGFHVRGARQLRGGHADSAGDHRLAMAFAVAALGGEVPSIITGAEAVDISYPGFFTALDTLCERAGRRRWTSSGRPEPVEGRGTTGE